MIKATAGDLLVLGLSRGNLEQLQLGHPMFFKLDAHPLRTEQLTRVFIFFGETEQGMRAELESLIGPETVVTASDAFTQSKGDLP